MICLGWQVSLRRGGGSRRAVLFSASMKTETRGGALALPRVLRLYVGVAGYSMTMG